MPFTTDPADPGTGAAEPSPRGPVRSGPGLHEQIARAIRNQPRARYWQPDDVDDAAGDVVLELLEKAWSARGTIRRLRLT